MNIRFFLLSGLLSFPYSAFGSDFQPLTDIYHTASEFVLQNIDPQLDHEIDITPLDRRLTLPLCATEIEAFTVNNKAIDAGRNSIGVRCSSGQNWTIYTSVTLRIYDHILVLKKPIRRGELFTELNLALEKYDISHLRNNFLNDAKILANKAATRNYPAGTVLTQASGSFPSVIRRGEKIQIRAGTPSFKISMQGIALMNGSQGQSIRVKNTSSGKTIAAKVIKQGLVSVIY